jgi:hypothetical protein
MFGHSVREVAARLAGIGEMERPDEPDRLIARDL